MSETLYRKYRPQLFKEIIGQEHIKITIQNEIERDKISHAYLFSGPRGIGKTTMARIFAKSINCKKKKDKEFEPCNECDSCISITEGNNLDIGEIDAASNRGINEIRELRERIKYAPSNGDYKVFIIDEVHMLTIEAFNALLKTLEEPPKHAIFILATTELHKLPVTIVSRCERFDFKVVDIGKLKAHLKNLSVKEKIKVSDNILEKVARYSQGYVRDALSMLGQVLSLADKNEVNDDTASLVMPKSDFQLIVSLIDNIVDEKFDLAIRDLNTLVNEGINLRYFTEELINYLRKVLLVKISGASEKIFFDIEKEVEEKIISQSKKLNLEIWHGILKEFYDIFEYLDNDGFKQLPLEMAVISIKNKYFYDSDKKIDDSLPPSIKNDSRIEKEDQNSVKKNYKSNKVLKNLNEKLSKEDTISEISTKNSDISIEDVIKVWSQLLINLKDYNHSLSAFVKVGHPLSIQGNFLNLGFKFKFHLDRVLQDEAKRTVEEILKSLLNVQLIISGELDDNYEKNHEKMVSSLYKEKDENTGMIDNLIQNFGGEVVN
jgi:DNA polymerase III subunit gamma/tau